MTKGTTTLFTACMMLLALAGVDADATTWPHWRGPNATGAAEGNPPATWSETENVKWKVPVPGRGHATPIVADGKIFLLTAIPTGEASAQPAEEQQGRGRGRGRGAPPAPHQFSVICLDQSTGERLWETVVVETTPHEGHHPDGSFASYSPVTDGERLYASFGSRGLYCLDFDGNVVWSKDLVQMQTRMGFGEGSSPALAGNAVIVLLDHQGDSKIVAYDKSDGSLLWEKPRDEVTTWSTPVAATVDGRTEVIVTATNRTRSYDVATGEVIWECGGQTANVIPTPIVSGGLVFCASGFRGNTLQAIKLGETGDLTDSDAVVWQVDRGTPYVPSPLLYDGRIYVLSNNRAVISCYEAATGTPVFTEQEIAGIANNVYASPVAAGGRIYVADRESGVAVLGGGTEFEVLTTNHLEQGMDASPVVIGDTLFLRTSTHLYAIAD